MFTKNNFFFYLFENKDLHYNVSLKFLFSILIYAQSTIMIGKKNSFYLSRKRDLFNVLLQHFVVVVNDKEIEMFSSFPCVGENFSFRQIENFVYYVLILLDR